MVLYDKSGLFLGMGSQELYLLGYEDMEEFRNYPADLTSTYRYVVENYAAKNPSAIIEIKTGLNVLFSLPGNEAIVLDMLYLLRIN